MKYIYGPVPSWRLGKSLGVDPVSTEKKTCSFDCVYCQLGRTINPITKRKVFIKLDDFVKELILAKKLLRESTLEKGLDKKELPIDYITFSGLAEPTLAENLSELVKVVHQNMSQPVAILTNSSLMTREDVLRDLLLFDVVVVKIDAPTEILFKKINRPFVNYGIEKIIEQIKIFSKNFNGRLELQMMFVDENKHFAKELVDIAKEIKPYRVQLNTPLRPCSVPPLSVSEMEHIEKEFKELNIINVYKSERPKVVILNERETRRRRPDPYKLL